MFTEQVQSLMRLPRRKQNVIFQHFSQLGNLNNNNHNPQLFETIGNHSHVRCLVLSTERAYITKTIAQGTHNPCKTTQNQLTELNPSNCCTH